MESTTITIKKVGGYVVVISLLLLGSVLCVWWVLSGQVSRASYDARSLVNYSGPALQESSIARTERYAITSKDIKNATIQNDHIAHQTIEKDKLSPRLVSWLEDLLANTLAALNIGKLFEDLESKLGLPLADITSLQILDGTISLEDLESSVGDSLSLIGTVTDNSVTSLKIVDGAIEVDDLEAGIVSSLGLIGSISDNSVTSLKIVDGSVGTVDIAASAITESLIESEAITTNLIQDGSISADDLTLGIINGALLADGAVSGYHIMDGAVNGLKILDGSIGAAEIATGAITSQLIADNTIAGGDIATGAIGTLQLADGAVSSAKILNNTITASDLANGAIGTLQLANGAVGTLQLSDGAVQANKLSTASGKKTVSVQIGDIGITVNDVERPIFIAPTAGTITKVTFTNALNITAGLNKGVLSVQRKTATTAQVASVDLSSVSLSSFVPQSPALEGGTVLNTGDSYSFKWDPGAVGVALTGFLVTIEYVPAE